MKTAVAIISGGLDSTVLAYVLKKRGYSLSLLSFDYGQRHKKELGYARLTAGRLEAPHRIINLTCLRELLPGSSLTDDIEVPEGHYAAENMKSTVVPNRNAIMLAIAWGHAVAIGAQAVAFGAHAGDHFVYPDCRPSFWKAIERAFSLGNQGFGDNELCLLAPFIGSTKAEIVTIGAVYGVPMAETWSCYKGGEIHCGVCGTCTERKEAFQLAHMPDPTVYEVR